MRTCVRMKRQERRAAQRLRADGYSLRQIASGSASRCRRRVSGPAISLVQSRRLRRQRPLQRTVRFVAAHAVATRCRSATSTGIARGTSGIAASAFVATTARTRPSTGSGPTSATHAVSRRPEPSLWTCCDAACASTAESTTSSCWSSITSARRPPTSQPWSLVASAFHVSPRSSSAARSCARIAIVVARRVGPPGVASMGTSLASAGVPRAMSETSATCSPCRQSLPAWIAGSRHVRPGLRSPRHEDRNDHAARAQRGQPRATGCRDRALRGALCVLSPPADGGRGRLLPDPRARRRSTPSENRTRATAVKGLRANRYTMGARKPQSRLRRCG